MTELQILLNRKKETIKLKAEINKMENGKKIDKNQCNQNCNVLKDRKKIKS